MCVIYCIKICNSDYLSYYMERTSGPSRFGEGGMIAPERMLSGSGCMGGWLSNGGRSGGKGGICGGVAVLTGYWKWFRTLE